MILQKFALFESLSGLQQITIKVWPPVKHNMNNTLTNFGLFTAFCLQALGTYRVEQWTERCSAMHRLLKGRLYNNIKNNKCHRFHDCETDNFSICTKRQTQTNKRHNSAKNMLHTKQNDKMSKQELNKQNYNHNTSCMITQKCSPPKKKTQ